MRVVELRLNDKQKLVALLYLARKVTASRLLTTLDGCEEMSVLRLETTRV
jgi:hypothetical protein